MKIDVIPATQISPESAAAWSRIQRAAPPPWDSPFFRPEFTCAVAAARGDVEVAVIEERAEPVGFFPFQRTRNNVGLPVGADLCDFQGVIAAPQTDWNAGELLRGCRLRAWHFNHLVATQAPLAAYHSVRWNSPYMDLADGFAAYRNAKRDPGGTIAQVERKQRKLHREVGPLRLVHHDPDPATFRLLLDWKVRQYQRRRAKNYLAAAWIAAVLERILSSQSDDFAGMLSVLYAGDRPAAAHFGMRSRGVFHVWFPAYDAELGKYSPGLVLLLGLARDAELLGIRRIDLGRGQERYKTSLQSGAIPLAEGSVDFRPLAGPLRRGWLRTREIVRASPLREPARTVVRLARQWFPSSE